MLPVHGDPVLLDGAEVGWVGSAARHYELGPIATVVVKRSVPEGATITIRHGDVEIAGALETVVV